MDRLYKVTPTIASKLFTTEKMYQYSLANPRKWIEVMSRRLREEYDALSELQKGRYKKRANVILLKEPVLKKRRIHSPDPPKTVQSSPVPVPLSINSDCLLNVLFYLTAPEVAGLRLVNQWFHEVSSSNFLWRCMFVADFSGELSIDHLVVKESESYLAEYISTYKSIPRPIDTGLKGDEIEGGEDYDQDTSFATQYQDYSILAIDTPAVTDSIHKLSAILGILQRNKYVPKLSDIVRIGYVHNNKRILLSHFCYAVLTGREKELFPQDDIALPQVDSDDENDDDVNNDDEFNEDLPRSVLNRPRLLSVGVAPDVKGEFEPFVYYCDMTKEIVRNDLSEVLFIREKEIIGNMEQVTSACVFRSDEKGWIAPNFFNASFTWFWEAKIYTIHKRVEGKIYVVKKERACPVF